jgi:hypothetical protein
LECSSKHSNCCGAGAIEHSDLPVAEIGGGRSGWTGGGRAAGEEGGEWEQEEKTGPGVHGRNGTSGEGDGAKNN